jgi:hypothetical protein
MEKGVVYDINPGERKNRNNVIACQGLLIAISKGMTA